MQAKDSYLRLDQNWTTVRQCNPDLLPISCLGEDFLSNDGFGESFGWREGGRKPMFPDTLLFRHGLWAVTPNCTDPMFEQIGSALGRFKRRVRRVVWHTNPWLREHGSIDPSDAEEDVQCTLGAAQRHNIDVLNIYKYILTNEAANMGQPDYHYDSHGHWHEIHQLRNQIGQGRH